MGALGDVGVVANDAKQNVTRGEQHGDERAGEGGKEEEFKDEEYNYYRNIFVFKFFILTIFIWNL